MLKKAQCYNCGKTLTITTGIAGPSEFVKDERDADGFDVFICGSIKSCRFKIDMNFYIKNKDNKNFIAKTVSADLDFSNGFDKPKKMKRSFFKKAKHFFGV